MITLCMGLLVSRIKILTYYYFFGKLNVLGKININKFKIEILTIYKIGFDSW